MVFDAKLWAALPSVYKLSTETETKSECLRTALVVYVFISLPGKLLLLFSPIVRRSQRHTLGYNSTSLRPLIIRKRGVE